MCLTDIAVLRAMLAERRLEAEMRRRRRAAGSATERSGAPQTSGR